MKAPFNPINNLYRKKHELTITCKHSLGDLIKRERMHPASIGRRDDMHRVV
jgi:hypothetical protein